MTIPTAVGRPASASSAGRSSPRSLATDGFLAGVLTMARLGFSFLAGAAMARALGAAGRGEVVYVVTCAAVVAMAGAAGITPATNRAGRALPTLSLVRPVIAVTMLRVLLVAVVAGGGWWALRGPVGPMEDRARVVLVVALALVVALQTTVAGLAGVRGRSVLVSAVYAAGTGVMVGAIAVLAVMDRLDLTAVLVLWVLTSAGGVLVVTIALVDARPPAGMNPLLGWSMGASWGDLALSTAWRLDNLLIGSFLGFADLARYSAAVAVAEVSLALITGVRLALLRTPDLTARHAASLALRLTVLLGAPLVLVVGVVGPASITRVFGPEFVGLGVVLVALLPGTLALGLSYVFFDQLTAAGRTGLVTCAGVGALVVNLAGNLVLMPRWGITGAAVASTIAYGSSAGVLWWGLTRSGPAPVPVPVAA